MSITLYTFTESIDNVTKVIIDPTDNSSTIYNGTKYISFTKTNPAKPDDFSSGLQPFHVKSIENNTDYFILVGGSDALEMLIGSVTDVPSLLKYEVDGTVKEPSLLAVRAIKKTFS